MILVPAYIKQVMKKLMTGRVYMLVCSMRFFVSSSTPHGFRHDFFRSL